MRNDDDDTAELDAAREAEEYEHDALTSLRHGAVVVGQEEMWAADEYRERHRADPDDPPTGMGARR